MRGSEGRAGGGGRGGEGDRQGHDVRRLGGIVGLWMFAAWRIRHREPHDERDVGRACAQAGAGAGMEQFEVRKRVKRVGWSGKGVGS